METCPRPATILPAFAAELEGALRREGRHDLADQVPELPLVDRCRCGDHFCASFHTAPPPSGAYAKGHSNHEVDACASMVILDLVDGAIHFAEVLDRPDVRDALSAALP